MLYAFGEKEVYWGWLATGLCGGGQTMGGPRAVGVGALEDLCTLRRLDVASFGVLGINSRLTLIQYCDAGGNVKKNWH